ncbi:MAG: HD domain-containing protein, partial [Clostridiales bacterium]|nr:HD domain-containing protein [Clostridiales bacterium]
DEFSLILSGFTAKDIENRLKHFNEDLKEYNGSTIKLQISLSYGYSFRQDEKVNTELMFQESDNNMYQNKLLKAKSHKNNFVRILMKALEAKDYVTEGHVNRMELLASKIGEAKGLSNKQIDRIKLLAKFHDIGKVGIPDTILKKTSSLTQDEWTIMKTHSNIGQRIAGELPELKEIAQLVLHHHEKWDGSGYPARLKGKEIPIECRIVSIADAFDAMTNDRPYRKALSREEAVREIRQHMGSQFDPELVEIFLLCIDQ